MNKIDTIKGICSNLKTLHERINYAGMDSSFVQGTYHHEIMYGMEAPLAAASDFFKRFTDDREPVQAIERIPSDRLQEISDRLSSTLTLDLEGSVLFFANVLSHRRGEKMSPKDIEKMKPIMEVLHTLKAYFEAREIYESA